MAKIIKLQPVLLEKTCDYCGDGLLKLKEQCDDGFHLFRKTKYWFEYECKKCGRITKSDKPFKLRDIVFVDPETKQYYRTFSNMVFDGEVM